MREITVTHLSHGLSYYFSKVPGALKDPTDMSLIIRLIWLDSTKKLQVLTDLAELEVYISQSIN